MGQWFCRVADILSMLSLNNYFILRLCLGSYMPGASLNVALQGGTHSLSMISPVTLPAMYD